MNESELHPDLAVWATNLDQGRRNATPRHPDDPDFPAHVAEAAQRLEQRHQVVATLAELRRKGSGLTQTQVADRWGRTQSRVSAVETDIATLEIGTLIDYVRALGGELNVTITVDDHSYTEQLV
jgi:predicted XRE-type DNA-binding protein